MIEEEVLDVNGVTHSVTRGDLVRILSKQSTSYGKIGHVRGFTGKRIQVHLPDRHYGRAFDANNLEFVCFDDTPRGIAYHKRWNTGHRPFSDSSEEGSMDSYIEDVTPSAHQPSGCVLF